jgi:glycosyltransferase involved in cell wall biosynthesis
MNTHPKLSIIIPTFNSALTVAETLESVLSQTFTDWEVLVMDGKSIDKTAAIVTSYVHMDERIRLISEKDSGVYDAMNKGITVSKGAFLYFLGSDDVFLNKETLTSLFDRLSPDVDVFYGNVQFKGSGRIYSGESSIEKLVYQQISICHQAIFYARNVFDRLGNYDLNYHIHADYDFNIRCFRDETLQIQFIDQIVAIFNEQGLSGEHANQDSFHTHLSEAIITEKYDLIGLYESHEQLKQELERIKTSNSFRFGNFVMQPIGFIKKKLGAILKK